MDLFIAAVIFGLLTGFHCVGMCGPIAISLPLSDQGWASKTIGGVIYNLGRVVTYSAMGAVFGLVGQGLELAGFQQWLAIAIGALMILSVFFPLLFNKFSSKSPLYNSVEKLKVKMGLLFGKRTNSALFTIGLLNGLLPCGPVYIAIGLSLAAGSALSGALYMAVFGLGTIPIMLTLSLLGNFISGPIRLKIRKIVPTFIVLMGIWFMLKGMGLGIHLLSPTDEKLHVEDKPKMELKNCCK